MSLLEKYLEGKKEMYAKFDEIREACDEAIDAAGGEFLDKFKTMIAGASDEEFYEFMCNSGDELDEIERMAALTARLENYGKRCRDEEEKEKAKANDANEKPKRPDGHDVFIIGRFMNQM